MIIDFHTHTFPDRLVEASVIKLAHAANIINHLDAKTSTLDEYGKKHGIDLNIILPVATKPSQTETINRHALSVNERYAGQNVLSFGGIHPFNENYDEILVWLKDNGFKGIKIHPVYQGVYFDDMRYKRIIYRASELGLITVTHAGYDLSIPGHDEITVSHILPVLDELDTSLLVLAHMGGWGQWDLVYDEIAGRNVYLDTAFSISPICRYDKEIAQMPTEAFVRLARHHGCDKVLFASDSPWADQSRLVSDIKNAGFDEKELDRIFWKNAAGLLNL